jgi:hypothetical protein
VGLGGGRKLEEKYLNDIIRYNYLIPHDSINANLKEYSKITDKITKYRTIGREMR